MPFPTTSTLDLFNRADGALGVDWNGGIFDGVEGWQIISNQAVGDNGTATAYWETSVGPDCEVHAKIQSTLDVRLYWRVTGQGAASATGYFLYRNGSEIYVYRDDGNLSWAQLGATISQAFSVGDSMGASHVGDTIEVWFKAGAGSWTSLTTRTDSTYNTAGKIGMYGSSIVDDFGGGTIVSAGGNQIGLFDPHLRPEAWFDSSVV